MQTKPMLNFDARRELPTLLLIDDDMVSREVTATVLTMSGYSVHTASDGAASLQLLAGGKCAPGAILMDAQMPGLTGIELIAQLRARTQAKVYVISASNPPAEVVAAADGFLLKPFDADALGKLLEGHKVQAAPALPSLLDPNDKVISPETLAQFRAMMAEAAVREIYVALVADLAKRMQTLEAAIARDDAAEVRRIGHAIKGGCGMAGALQAARVGAMFEDAAPESKGNQLDNSIRLLRDLHAATRNLERMLKAELPA
jgi:CheY-like chemotaxis protein